MSNKILAGLLVVIAVFLIVIALIFTRHKTPSPVAQYVTPPTPTIFHLKETHVELTSSGFSPKTVTIKKDDGVVWTNKSGEKATINSADHPTHKKFPELNLGEFANNQSMNHVFTKPGTYEYHNHYNPQETGTVIVQ